MTLEPRSFGDIWKGTPDKLILSGEDWALVAVATGFTTLVSLVPAYVLKVLGHPRVAALVLVLGIFNLLGGSLSASARRLKYLDRQYREAKIKLSAVDFVTNDYLERAKRRRREMQARGPEPN